MKIFIAIIVLVLSLTAYTQTASAQPAEITSEQTIDISSDCTYILMDMKNGQVIAERDADKKMHPASTTKIMTAIIALENGDLDHIMTVSKDALDIRDGESNIGIMPGEKNLTLENLLNAMLVKSANDAANIIAEDIGGTRSKFVDMMNKKAVELGAISTHFVNPSGIDNSEKYANHLSTARDLATIARYAMSIPIFREIAGKEYYSMPVTNDHPIWAESPLHNRNKLLWPVNSYSYELDSTMHTYSVDGIKTGSTVAAGYNLVASAVNDEGIELIAVVLHASDSDTVFNYTKELLSYGFEQYPVKSIASINQTVEDANVGNANVGMANVGIANGQEIEKTNKVLANTPFVKIIITVLFLLLGFLLLRMTLRRISRMVNNRIDNNHNQSPLS